MTKCVSSIKLLYARLYSITPFLSYKKEILCWACPKTVQKWGSVHNLISCTVPTSWVDMILLYVESTPKINVI